MSTADLPPTTSPVANSTAEFLGVPEFRRRVHAISVESYQRVGAQGLIDEKTELIRGVIVDKMSKSPLHNWLLKKLAKWLDQGIGGGWSVRADAPLTLRDSEPEPDVAVAAGDDDDFRDRHPTTAALVIEVSVTSEKYDREKAAIYAEAEVGEYWIVLAERQQVEVYLKPQEGRYTETKMLGVNDVLRPQAFAGLAMPIAELFPPTN